MQRPLPVRTISFAAALALIVTACTEAPDLIVLGPLPQRPPPLFAEDAGVVLPDGAIACDSDADCDDGVECTRDQCVSGGYCRSTSDYSRCSDGVYCNGIEICDPAMGCVPGVRPSCDDMEPCTIDRCDEELKQCVYGPRDFDHDGEVDIHCRAGTDCDDFDDTRGTRFAEICGDAVDNDCDDTVDERVCGQPEHDICSDALEIGDGGVYEVSLVGAVSDYDVGCGRSMGTQDVVFTFELSEPSDVWLEGRGIFADGSIEIATLSLQTRCGVLSSELQCAQGFPSFLRVRALPAGRYYVVASSIQSRSLWLSMRKSAATQAPENAVCENAIDVGAGGRFEGDFIDVGDAIQSVCGVSNQPDVFYKVRLERESDLEISAVSQEPGELTISVRDGCAPESTVRGCRSAQPALTRLHQLPAGEYIIVLEGPTSREVGYALEVAVLDPTPPPAGDSCDAPTPLAMGESRQILLSDKQAEVTTSCETTGPDAVFSLALDAARDVVLRVDSDNALAVVALQETCGDVSSERGCRVGGPIETRLRNIGPGNYFVVVDSPSAPSVTVAVETFPPTPTISASGNDDCLRALEIPITGGIFSGDTRTLLNDYRASCGGQAASRDAVFKLVLTQPTRVTARLDSGFDGVLHRIADSRTTSDVCTDVASEACSDTAAGGTGAELQEQLPPGTHYYVVDGFGDFSAGYYQLEVTTAPP